MYHPWVYLKGGAERVLCELVGRSRHEWTVLTHHYEQDSTFPELSEHRVVELRPAVSVRRGLVPLATAAALIGSTRLELPGIEGVLVSSEGFGDLILMRNRHLPAVCYCHTPLKIVHDPVARRRVLDAGGSRALALRVLGPLFHGVDRRLWRRYRRILVNSGETGFRLRRSGFELDAGLEVLHPGVDMQRFGAEPGWRTRTFLVAGRIMWQKNVELAIDALAEARRDGLDADMVIAGAVDRKSAGYVAALRRRAASLPVRFLPDPSDAQLRALYASALAVVFPALNEEWGIVALEAMAAGTPVIAVDSGGPRESIVDGVTGWLVPPSTPAFADRMRVAAEAEDGLMAMRSEARARAELFDWDRFVHRVDEVMEEVCSPGRTASSAAPARRASTA